MKKATLAVVVPAYNEERVLNASLPSLLRQIDQRHIYLVSDGSTDQTAKIARQHLGKNTLALRENVGKARALDRLIKRFSITKRYQYVFFFDADTEVGPGFIREVKKMMPAKPACIVGTVTSQRRGFISAFRVYEYGLSHRIFKSAQSAVGTIAIAPGCTAVYRSDVLDELNFQGPTITEDFDLTLQVHKKRLGKIVYCATAKVKTQDPLTVRDYWKQIMRWNTGFWQNFFLHRLFLPNSKLNLEILLLLGDFFLWMATIVLAALHPLYFLWVLGVSAIITAGLASIVIIIERQYWALPYSPFFSLFQWLNITSLLISIPRAIGWRTREVGWGKVARY